MSNMPYCRFENTLHDIEECTNAIYDGEVNIKDMSSYEKSAFMKIAEACKELAEAVEDHKITEFEGQTDGDDITE